MPVFVVLLKLRNQLLSADNVFTYLVVLIVLPLNQLQSEVLLAQLIVARQVKVEPASGNSQSWDPVHNLESSLHGDLVLIKLLCT